MEKKTQLQNLLEKFLDIYGNGDHGSINNRRVLVVRAAGLVLQNLEREQRSRPIDQVPEFAKKNIIDFLTTSKDK